MLTLKTGSVASTKSHGKCMKFVSFHWWQHKHYTAADVKDSKKNYPYNQDSVMSIISYHLLQAVQKTISDQNHISYEIRFKGRHLNVLAYIYIYIYTHTHTHTHTHTGCFTTLGHNCRR